MRIWGTKQGHILNINYSSLGCNGGALVACDLIHQEASAFLTAFTLILILQTESADKAKIINFFYLYSLPMKLF
ncbi:hypothetical protein BuS5_01197 [Desulfosarcina sp. BuS5]|nr:hypothetical protein BuS5_01197 [Desulfosarcina sp. BuS5]